MLSRILVRNIVPVRMVRNQAICGESHHFGACGCRSPLGYRGPSKGCAVVPAPSLALDPGADLAQGLREVAETMVAPSRSLDLLGDVGRKLHPDAARQGGLPLDQLPLAALPAILARLDECSPQFDLGAQQVFPLIPSGIPNDWHGRLVKYDFKFSPSIAVNGTIAVEVKPTQGRVEAALPLFGPERQDSGGEERLTIARVISGCQNRTEAAIGKEYWRGWIPQQRVIASPQFRLSQDDESPLHRATLALRSAGDAEFHLPELEG